MLHEKLFSITFKNFIKVINPIKKKIMKTECKVHIFINNQSLNILLNDGYANVYNLMSSYIHEINAGVVWADLDLKSSNHFYNPHIDKGLYGNSNAKKECMYYYSKALQKYYFGDYNNAMFYLGAACHLIQDLTVPQHANIMLLNSHRSFEKWVIKMYKHHDEFKTHHGGIYLNHLDQYIHLNTRKAIKTFNQYSQLKNRHKRFFKITSIILIMAQKTTAGFMKMFYEDLKKFNLI